MTVQSIIKGINSMRGFSLAGNAYFTLLNTSTGNRVTFNVEKVKDGTYVVRAFTGSKNNNRNHYSYLGMIQEDGTYLYNSMGHVVDALLEAAKEKGDSWLSGFCENMQKYLANGWGLTERQKKALERNIRRHKVSTHKVVLPGDMKAKVFAWFWNHLSNDRELPDVVEFWHEGRCCKCARRLTVPESIKSGIGPVCAERAA